MINTANIPKCERILTPWQQAVVEVFLLSDGFDDLTANAATIVGMCLPNQIQITSSGTLVKIYYWDIMRALKTAAQNILPIVSLRVQNPKKFDLFIKRHPELREILLLADMLRGPLKRAAMLQMRLVVKNNFLPLAASLKQLLDELLSPAEFEVLKLHQKLVAGEIDEEDIVARTEYSLRQFIIIRDEVLNKLKNIPALSKILS